MTTTTLKGLANPLLNIAAQQPGMVIGGTTGTSTGTAVNPEFGIKKVSAPTTTNKPCPVDCREENTPVTYYLSTQPSPGSVPVRGQQRRIICDTPPQGAPSIPCEELNNALLNMGTNNRASMSERPMPTNPLLNDRFSTVFYSEFL